MRHLLVAELVDKSAAAVGHTGNRKILEDDFILDGRSTKVLGAELVEVSGSGGHYPLLTVAGDSQFRRKQVELWVGFAQNLYIQEPTPSTISSRIFPGTSWLTRFAIASMIMAKICDSRV